MSFSQRIINYSKRVIEMPKPADDSDQYSLGFVAGQVAGIVGEVRDIKANIRIDMVDIRSAVIAELRRHAEQDEIMFKDHAAQIKRLHDWQVFVMGGVFILSFLGSTIGPVIKDKLFGSDEKPKQEQYRPQTPEKHDSNFEQKRMKFITV
jgi:hypothetical protein